MFRDTYAPEVSPIGAAILHQIGERKNRLERDRNIWVSHYTVINEIKKLLTQNLLIKNSPGISDVTISPMYRTMLCSAIKDYVTNHYKDGIDINTLTQILVVEWTSIHEKCLHNALKAMESRDMIEITEEWWRITYIRKAE